MPQQRNTRFNEGDIITRDDASYPAGALVVNGYGENGELLAYPKGGGPEFRIPAADIARFSIVDQFEQVPIYRKSHFLIDGVEGEFAGWWDGECWNGWAKPRFEFAEAEKVVAALGRGAERYDPVDDAFITAITDEEETWESETITLPDGGTIKVYPVGAGSWIWDETEGGT
jgi:hypothetical protein